MNNKVLQQLQKILGKDNVFTGKAELEAYASDASIYRGSPQAILAPTASYQLKLVTSSVGGQQLTYHRPGGRFRFGREELFLTG